MDFLFFWQGNPNILGVKHSTKDQVQTTIRSDTIFTMAKNFMNVTLNLLLEQVHVLLLMEECIASTRVYYLKRAQCVIKILFVALMAYAGKKSYNP